ncbi:MULTISPECIES: LuxR family transcriptional regulator [unclassified Isoptericola]|uniref:helix-turn-helix transcriptional regulator n=1 Tax=unclassified Isoptericola TaxID=2623355 RepID=UPI002712504F|nr:MULTISPECIES: LuxR family transcriptional regulator [unclassified Isoptericola]MDO8149671.1 LuxR C-terminal-related transcriptional regulator [Isoptericola sp. b515]MDO8152606.1 LuxR C-terminal-related transcriptional regulator [Isoptericola sp. b408]
MGAPEDLDLARAAYERRDWISAYRLLSALDDDALVGPDFVALATAAYLVGRHDDVVQALHRAYRSSEKARDLRGAARAALWLTTVLEDAGERAVAHGWLSRAEGLLGRLDEDVVEHGYLRERQTFAHLARGEIADALALAPTVTAYGRRFADPDLAAAGLVVEGRLRIYTGDVPGGLALVDEAMASVVAGETSPIYSGLAFCAAIEACQELSDLGRAHEWTRAMSTWCDRQAGLVAFTGQCAVHRGQLLRMHGAFPDAVRELEDAAARHGTAGGGAAAGLAHYERGEALRVLGREDDAASAYDRATGFGHPGQPGRSLLWLARGETDAAERAIRVSLAEAVDPVRRSALLPAAVEILTAAGEVDEAAGLADEIRATADEFGSVALAAAGAYATASVALARGDAERALAAARRAGTSWGGLEAPYECARCRVLVARALRALGDERSALAELEPAARTFAELGAMPASAQVAALLPGEERPGGLSAREVEVLCLVAEGYTNAEIAAELVLSVKTVARHLSNIFAKLDVGSRAAAVAYAYEHRLV